MCPSFKEKISEFADDPKIGAKKTNEGTMQSDSERFGLFRLIGPSRWQKLSSV